MWAEGDLGAPALSRGNQSLTYAELRRRVNSLALVLEQLEGIVAVRAHNDFGTVAVLLAALEVGRPAAMLPPLVTEPEHARISTCWAERPR